MRFYLFMCIFSFLSSCLDDQTEALEQSVWLSEQQMIDLQSELQWSDATLPSAQWMGAFQLSEADKETDVSKGFDLPLIESLREVERRLLLLKKISWGLPGFTEPALMPIGSAKVLNNKLVIEASILSSDFEDVISQKRVNIEGTYVLMDHPNGWLGIKGQVLTHDINGVLQAASHTYLSSPQLPFKTWSYLNGGYFFATPVSQDATIVSYAPHLSESFYTDGFSELAMSSTHTLSLESDALLRERYTSFYKGAVLFDEQYKQWAGEVVQVNGDWDVYELPVLHYQQSVEQPWFADAGQAADRDLHTDASSLGLTRATGDAVDLDCDGVTLTGEGSSHSYLGGAGWHVAGDFQVVSHQTYGLNDPVPSLDVSQASCLLTTGDGSFQTQQSTPLNPLGGQISSFWQQLNIPETAQSVRIRAAWWTQEKPWESLGGDRFLIRWDESNQVIASGHMRSLVEGECLENNCGDWSQVTSLPGNMSSSRDRSDDHDWMYPYRMICAPLTDQMRGQSMTLRFVIADVGDRWVDSGMAIDSVVFSDKGCDQQLTDAAVIRPLS